MSARSGLFPVLFYCLAAAEDSRLAFTRRLEDHTPCGVPEPKDRAHECSLDYSLDLVRRSASEHTPFDPVLRRSAAMQRHEAHHACHGSSVSSILENGGWCLEHATKMHMHNSEASRDLETEGETVSLPNNQSYEVPPHHVAADESILRHIISMVDADPLVTINDFGAGVGQYGQELLAARPKARYLGYDGAGNVEVFTKGFLQWFDLTTPLALPKADWVMSLEVGEHISHEKEMMVIRNLHAHNTKGLILSWAGVTQGGNGHINTHSSAYLISIFEALGYDYDEAASEAIRAKAAYWWFRRTLHIFRRQVQLHSSTTSRALDLEGAPAADRDLQGLVSIDMTYRFHVSPKAWENAPSHSYNSVMQALHRENIWKNPRLRRTVDSLTRNDTAIHGSPLAAEALLAAIKSKKPRIIMEVGVFRGATSIHMAKLLDETPGCEDSFILSMDTWLLDLRFQWGGAMSTHTAEVAKAGQQGKYFRQSELGGSSLMYWTFLGNVMRKKASHRIIPMRTASQNGALALVSHQIRPELIYLDASHANPDVAIDMENFYNLLKPGGIIFFDDTKVPAVAAALASLLEHIPGIQATYFGGSWPQASVEKPL